MVLGVICIALLLGGGYFLSTLPVGKRIAAHTTGLFVQVPTAPVRLALPPPTGPHAIGTTALHLIDDQRDDPWVTGQPRELMVSVWYPTQTSAGYLLAPYMDQPVAQHYTQISLEDLGIPPTTVDLSGIRTHGWQDAAVDTRLGAQPVVLFSPGGSQSRALGTTLIQDLASRGYIVVAIDHTYEAPVVVFPDGRIDQAEMPNSEDTLQKMIAVRVQNTRFVLDQLERIRDGENPTADGRPLPEGLPDALDLTNMGMFGHSAGGFTSAQTMYEDTRLDAGVNLDGSLGYRISEGIWGEVTEQGLDRPFLIFGAGFSGAERLPHTSVYAPDWQSFWEHSTGWKLNLHLPEGEHFSFTDHQVFLPALEERFDLPDWLLTRMIGGIDPNRSVQTQQDYIAAFFDQHLRGKQQPLLEGAAPHYPDVDFVHNTDQ
ncbi:MAG: putative dienelactone hydrolase [Chloroflexi bacterium AL-W]|nr:putative dienelactone hydrolase [Chloroflexi bacterium AL-N1]NOK65035.1 putative dienelactone hydrolase [Chloroflexi bacterium AL-N10]NOK76805.1 putative dienelactone hydrolase [Chloroflexi bacterium AL-N5]NOK84697.1 putative dienelactone hydrolase [Chloroflexi bacterium AL-W]NOK86478.1 putative dienelactone hydrolase [Chloroflexi bacterium AL-N15]